MTQRSEHFNLLMALPDASTVDFYTEDTAANKQRRENNSNKFYPTTDALVDQSVDVQFAELSDDNAIKIKMRARYSHKPLPGRDDHQIARVENPGVEDRHLVCYINFRDDMLTFGYIGSELVFFSRTKMTDRLSSRRIFDMNVYGSFYRTASVEAALSVEGLVPADLEDMCMFRLDNICTEKPVFDGFIKAEGENMTGNDFAQFIADMPANIKTMLDSLGSPDDIIIAMNKDIEFLDKLYGRYEPYSDMKQKQALNIQRKWAQHEFLKLSDRASLRILRKKILTHKAATVFETPQYQPSR